MQNFRRYIAYFFNLTPASTSKYSSPTPTRHRGDAQISKTWSMIAKSPQLLNHNRINNNSIKAKNSFIFENLVWLPDMERIVLEGSYICIVPIQFLTEQTVLLLSRKTLRLNTLYSFVISLLENRRSNSLHLTTNLFIITCCYKQYLN